MQGKLLIVEDDPAMSVALCDGFRYDGFDVAVARDGPEALRLASQAAFDLIVLDLMLPGCSGLDVCRRLRAEGSLVPIIMLTARGQEIDKVIGLETGADDYVTKPFSFMELLARVRAVMRRTSRAAGTGEPGLVEFGDVTIDVLRHTASKSDAPLELTPREYRLIAFFARHRGEVLTREQLLDGVWGYDSASFTRTVDTHIAKLRKKVEDTPDDPRYILTIHRVGYKFVG